jgi:hypothetical protein
MKGYAILLAGMMIIIAIIPSITPWQLFQSMCPYIGAQSPQCQVFTQQQQPYQQQQQPFLSQPQPYQQQQCPNGSLPDVNGSCPIF